MLPLNSTEPVNDLITNLSAYLKRREVQLKAFYKFESQLEGWLKGELITFLDHERLDHRIYDFEREARIPESRKRVDFRIDFAEGNGIKNTAWIELKHWHIGKQKGIPYTCKFYFGDSNKGIVVDVRKLDILESECQYLLILMTKNPEKKDWDAGIEIFNRKFSPYLLRPLTQPTDYPDSFFLGLLRSVSNRHQAVSK
ncbi:MAG: hypothetical protein HYW28_14760 [Rhodospirillales bacterium]|nr:hypothetical protein [Rhodospirillales bacterium]